MWHGLARAIRRGLANMKIQAYLTAAAINLKRLAVAFCTFITAMIVLTAPPWAIKSTIGSKLSTQRLKHAMGA